MNNDMIDGQMIPGMGDMNMNPNMGMNPNMNPNINPNMNHNMNPGMNQNMMNPVSLYKPESDGTLISDLMVKGGSQHNPNHNPNPYSRPMPTNYRRQEFDSERSNYSSRSKSGVDSESSYASIRELANDVNNSLQALEKLEKNKKNNDSDESEEELDPDSETNIVLAEIEAEHDYLKLPIEFLLLLTLYVIMSQPFVFSLASSYIKQLVPKSDGEISMSGIIIYGLIMTIMFMVVRKVVFSRL